MVRPWSNARASRPRVSEQIREPRRPTRRGVDHHGPDDIDTSRLQRLRGGPQLGPTTATGGQREHDLVDGGTEDLGGRTVSERWTVDDDVVVLAQLLQQPLHRRKPHMLATVTTYITRCQHGETGLLGRHHQAGEVCPVGSQRLRQPGTVGDPEHAMSARAVKVSVNEDGLTAGLRKRKRHVGGRR